MRNFKIISNPPFIHHLFIQVTDKALFYTNNNTAVVLQPINPYTNSLFKKFHPESLKYHRFWKLNELESVVTGNDNFEINLDVMLGICVYKGLDSIEDVSDEIESNIIDKIFKYIEYLDTNSIKYYASDKYIEGVSCRLPNVNGSFRICSPKFELFKKKIDDEEAFYINSLTDISQQKNFFDTINSDFYICLRRLFSKGRQINHKYLPYLHDYSHPYSVKDLCNKFEITDEEWNYLYDKYIVNFSKGRL